MGLMSPSGEMLKNKESKWKGDWLENLGGGWC